MTDFWRIANVIIVVTIIIFVIWLQKCKKCKKSKPQATKSAKLDELKNRKQKLACDLKNYEEDLTELEADSRQMMEDYFAEQKAYVNKLVKEEVNAALDEMETNVKADMRQSFEKAKTRLQKGFDDK